MREIDLLDEIRFMPQNDMKWWTVRARDARYIIATRQAPFKKKGHLQYTVVDLTGWTQTYNGVPPGKVRSSVDLIGGGYDLGPEGENCEQMLEELQNGELGLSYRRVMPVHRIIKRLKK